VRRVPRPALLALVAVLALAALGIAYALSDGTPEGGGGGGEAADAASEEQRAADAVLRHFRAIRARDGAAACAELSPAGRRALAEELRGLGASGRCEQAVLELEVPAPLRVEEVTIAGERAMVVLAGGLEYDLERVGGEWKLAG
jgi:hypothetical protein